MTGVTVLREAIYLEQELSYSAFVCTWNGGNCCASGYCCQHEFDP